MSSFVDEVISGWKNGKISTTREPDEVLDTVLLSLHNTIRFNGLCRKDYNVLSHSWLVGVMSQDLAKMNGGNELQQTKARLAGMTHDFGEVIVGDIVWPLKTQGFEQAYSNYRQLEEEARKFIVEYTLGISYGEFFEVGKYVSEADSFFGMLETLGASQTDDYSCYSYLKPLFDNAIGCRIGDIQMFGAGLKELANLLN